MRLKSGIFTLEKCQRNIQNYDGAATLAETSNNILVTGSYDSGVIKFWNIGLGVANKEPEIIICNGGKIWALTLIEDNQLAVGNDEDINIYDFCKQNAPVKVLRGHSLTVKCLFYHTDNCSKLISGSLDTSVKIWNIHKGVCVRTFTTHVYTTSRLFLLNHETLVTSDFDGTVKFWNLEDGVCIRTVYENRKIGMIRSDGVWVSVCSEGKFALWY